MARPINLFQGPAPQAMSMMGAGLSEAGANIARTLQQGYAALGEGIEKAAGAYKQSKDLNAANSVTKSVLGSKELYKQLFPDSTEEQRIQQLDTFKQIGVNNGAVGQAQFTSQFLGPLMQDAAMGKKFRQEQELQKLKIAGDMAIQAAAGQRKTFNFNVPISDLDKEAELLADPNSPLPSLGKPSAVSSIPLIEGGQQDTGMNSADMLGDFLKKKYGKSVANPSNQDILEFEKFLQSTRR